MAELRHLEHGHDIVFHAHLAEHAGLLGQIAYACPGVLVDGVVGDVDVVEAYAALVGHYQTGGHIERGGLACTVGSEQSHDFSLLHMEVDLVDHRALAISFYKTLCAEGHHHVVCIGHK